MIQEVFQYHGEYIVLGFVAAAFALLLLRQFFCNRAPEYIAAATVESRRLGIAQHHGKHSSGADHLVTFRLNGPETVELYVSRTQYETLTEGLRGTLHWQNETMLSFEADTEQEK